MGGSVGWAIVKPRETRRKVVIKARLRAASGWHDACILDVSSRGMMLQTPAVAARGAYVEIRRGQQVIVARVAWAQQQRFGVQSQDPVPIEALLGQPEREGPAASSTMERRAVPRPIERRHEESRERGKRVEFAGLVLAGTCAAMVAFGADGEALARPVAAISAVMAPATLR